MSSLDRQISNCQSLARVSLQNHASSYLSHDVNDSASCSNYTKASSTHSLADLLNSKAGNDLTKALQSEGCGDLEGQQGVASTWKRFKRNDCPVCSGTKKDCRQSLSTGLVFCRSGIDQAGELKLIKTDAHGFGVYGTGKQSPEAREQWAQQKAQREQAKLEQLAGLLPNDQRDRHYRTIARASGLASPERAELSRRGLTGPQIDWAHEQGFISSWVHGSCGNLGLSTAIAGVSHDGSLTGYTGLAIYFHDAVGNAVGGQVRPRSEQARKQVKYGWISSVSQGGNGPQLRSGALPLAVWKHPNLDLSQPVQIESCEGGLKSLLVALRHWQDGNHQIIVIGAAGGLFAGLGDVLAEFPTAESFTLHPDAGAQDNQNLRRNYRKAIAQTSGLNPKLSWWNQASKHDDLDVDELSPKQLQQIELITLEQWLGQRSSSSQAAQWQSSLKGCPHRLWVEIDGEWIGSTLREVFEDLKANNRNLIGLSAPTGTGKTFSTKQLAALLQAAGFQVIEVQVTEALAEDQSRELGIPYRKGGGADGDAGHICPGESFVTCIQALRDDCKNIDWETIVSPEKPLVLLIDEADKALSIAKKFGQHRRILGNLCRKAETTIGMSAQIKQRHMQLLADLAGLPLEESIIIHKAQPSVVRQVIIHERQLKAPSQGLDDRQTEAGLDGLGGSLEEAKQDLDSGKRVLVLTGGQRGDSKTGTMFLARFFAEQCPSAKILEVSSQTVRDPKHPAYRIASLTNQQKTELIERHDLTIGSPVIREGFSIEAKIDNAYVFDQGAMTVEDLIQNGGRARYAPIVTIVSTENPTQLRYGGETDSAIISKRINAAATSDYNKQVLELQHGRHAKLNLSSPWATFHAEDIAQNNAGSAAKAQNLQRYFEGVGVDVLMADMPNANAAFDSDLKAAFKASSTEFRENVAIAKHLNKSALEDVEQKGQMPLPIYYQVQRRKVVDAFKLDIEDILKDEPDLNIPTPNVSPALVGMERQRGLAKGWLRTSSILGGGYWGCVAEDMARLGYPPKGWEGAPNKRTIKVYAPDHRQNVSAHYRLLEDIGIIELLRNFAVAKVDLSVDAMGAIVSSATPESVVKQAQAAHPEKVFSLKNSMVLDCAKRMDEIGLDIINASLPGVSIQSNKDGSIWGGQVMTLIRNYFQAKTFYDPQKRAEGSKGAQLIVFDDKAIQLRKFVKGFDGETHMTLAEVQEQWETTPRRADYSDIWNIKRWKALRDLVRETGVLSEENQESYSDSTPHTTSGANLALRLATKRRAAYLETLRIKPEISNPEIQLQQLALLGSVEVA